MSDDRFPVAPPSTAQDHPPHRLILKGQEQALFMQVYPPGHIFNSATNPEGKVVLIGKRLGGQQRVHIRAHEIDSMIEALQYAKAKLLRGET